MLEENSKESNTEATALCEKEDRFYSMEVMVSGIVEEYEKERTTDSSSQSKTIDAVQALQFAQTDIETYNGEPTRFQEYELS